MTPLTPSAAPAALPIRTDGGGCCRSVEEFVAKIKELRLKPVIGVVMGAALDSFEMLCLLFRME